LILPFWGTVLYFLNGQLLRGQFSTDLPQFLNNMGIIGFLTSGCSGKQLIWSKKHDLSFCSGLPLFSSIFPGIQKNMHKGMSLKPRLQSQ